MEITRTHDLLMHDTQASCVWVRERMSVSMSMQSQFLKSAFFALAVAYFSPFDRDEKIDNWLWRETCATPYPSSKADRNKIEKESE